MSQSRDVPWAVLPPGEMDVNDRNAQDASSPRFPDAQRQLAAIDAMRVLPTLPHHNVQSSKQEGACNLQYRVHLCDLSPVREGGVLELGVTRCRCARFPAQQHWPAPLLIVCAS